MNAKTQNSRENAGFDNKAGGGVVGRNGEGLRNGECFIWGRGKVAVP